MLALLKGPLGNSAEEILNVMVHNEVYIGNLEMPPVNS
jgi:hypothetical protein